MEKEFVPYEIALALKELGFDEPCLLFIQYSSGTDVYTRKKYKNSIWLGNGYDAEIGDKKIKYKFPKHSEQGYGTLEIPLYQQAFRWFLEKYNMFAETTLWGDGIGYMSSIKEIRQEEFKVVYDLGLATPNRGLPNWDKNTENLACLNKMLEIVRSRGSLDTDKWRVLVNPLEREDLLLSISSSSPDFTEFDEKSQRESYITDNGTYEVIWETDNDKPIVRKFIG
jgi:hypothetical protein